MAIATLEAIRQKVRRLTQSPSVNQLSVATLDEYINTFIAYDFPEELRLFSLNTTLTFYTDPFVDTYSTNSILNSPLENFKNEYLTIEPPVYIAGRESTYFQSRADLFNIFPQNVSIKQVASGDGASTIFTGTLSAKPVQQKNVLFSSISNAGDGLKMIDVPFDATTGNLVVPNNDPPLFLDPGNFINYVTGQFAVTFPSAPGNGAPIDSQTFPYVAGRPTTVLYYDNEFTVRPIPDMPYKITFDAYVRPTQLMALNDEPNLEQWWQYIAYGTSKKVLEDRMDMDTVQLIMPEFKKQERLVLRRTIVQNTTQKTATIYGQQTNGTNNFNFNQQS